MKKSNRTPFNAKPQTHEKYQAVLNSPSTLEPTASTSDEDSLPSGTAAPKGEEHQRSIPRRRVKKGRRTSDKNWLSDFIKNPLTWGLVPALIAACVWASGISHSVNGLEIGLRKLGDKFDQFSGKTIVKLELMHQSLKDTFASPTANERPSKEYNLFNFSRDQQK